MYIYIEQKKNYHIITNKNNIYNLVHYCKQTKTHTQKVERINKYV